MLQILEYNQARDYPHILAACKAEGWKAFYTFRKQPYQKALSASATLVAYDGDRYCGYARFITDGFFTIYCCEIIVHQSARRKGVGSALIDKILELYPHCSVDVISDNDSFYAAHDFIAPGSGMRKLALPKPR